MQILYTKFKCSCDLNVYVLKLKFRPIQTTRKQLVLMSHYFRSPLVATLYRRVRKGQCTNRHIPICDWRAGLRNHPTMAHLPLPRLTRYVSIFIHNYDLSNVRWNNGKYKQYRLTLLPNGKLRHYTHRERFFESMEEQEIRVKIYGRLNEPLPKVKEENEPHFYDYDHGKYCMDKVNIKR